MRSGHFLELLGTSVLAGIAGGLFASIVADAAGVSVPLAAGVAGTLMAVLVTLIIIREWRHAA
jgi:hypothetical protein